MFLPSSSLAKKNMFVLVVYIILGHKSREKNGIQPINVVGQTLIKYLHFHPS